MAEYKVPTEAEIITYLRTRVDEDKKILEKFEPLIKQAEAEAEGTLPRSSERGLLRTLKRFQGSVRRHAQLSKKLTRQLEKTAAKEKQA